MKLTIVGGGSTYTPELNDGFTRHPELALTEIHLVDPDPHRLELVAGVSRRMLARAGHPARVVAGNDLVAGVADADFVLLHVETASWRFQWYVFNLADVAIVAGVLILLYESVRADSAAKAP